MCMDFERWKLHHLLSGHFLKCQTFEESPDYRREHRLNKWRNVHLEKQSSQWNRSKQKLSVIRRNSDKRQYDIHEIRTGSFRIRAGMKKSFRDFGNKNIIIGKGL